MNYEEYVTKKMVWKVKCENQSRVQGMLLLMLLVIVVLVVTGCKKEEINWNTNETKWISSEDQKAETEQYNEADQKGDKENEATKRVQNDETDLCYVYVCGEVKNPGVYSLLEGSRVYEAIELAGGLSELAAADYINQAEMIKDGMKLNIPTKEEAVALEERVNSEKDGLVNINTASKETLMSIPGIGEGRAQAILDYREKSGGFISLEDLLKVDGIKQGIYDKMKNHITL